ncbi:hypothetical protein ACF3DV_24905 [Chlorogloeopsis fritschii PCC 9212]|uniref:Uncharacterized protein n=1 Tax=Chlorogloeopsis fritschii PCC 6912 TaxID=211165 RepID=A0A433NPH1_CHLFR|nr:hypothetical protein [Chlorogloeopsis fritschii]RUR85703.1 hypothetical protein PCC6912_05280 [Chlorogloeopsis fritschii PCC 6912]
MTNLVSKVFASINSLLQGLQVKRFLSIILVGCLLLTTNVAFGNDSQNLTEKVREKVQQNDAQRPKTVGQWNREARETEGNPGERLQRIGQQSGEAFKEFGSGYAEGSKETARDVGEGAANAGKDIPNQVRR